MREDRYLIYYFDIKYLEGNTQKSIDHPDDGVYYEWTKYSTSYFYPKGEFRVSIVTDCNQVAIIR